MQPLVMCTTHQNVPSWHKEHVSTLWAPATRHACWHKMLAKFDFNVVCVSRKDKTVGSCLGHLVY